MTLRTNEFGQPIGDDLHGALPDGPPAATELVGRWCSVVPLRPEEHAAALYRAFREAPDDRGWTYLSVGPFATEGEFAAWLALVGNGADQSFFVVDDGHGPCGIASYLRIAPAAGSVEVGSIHFADRLARTTAATEAMYLMMRRAFEHRYRRYEWKCDALNAASRRAALRLGFSFEGVFRQATAYKGRSRDTAWFSVIDTEWPGHRAEFERWLDPGNFDGRGRQRSALAHVVSS